MCIADKDLAAILRRDFSEDFVAKMKGSMLQSHYKYGWVSDTYPELADAIACLKQRLELYEKDGNIDHLVDVANFAMIESMYPRHPNAHFERLVNVLFRQNNSICFPENIFKPFLKCFLHIRLVLR